MHQKRALCSLAPTPFLRKVWGLALILVFSGGAFFVAPQKASAVVSCIPAITPVPDIPVSVPTQSVGAAIRQNISNTFQASNFTKECILDALVTFLKEALIQNLTGSIVDWINNDFEGGPAFVTDPAGFFVNIADETAGHFIETQLGPIGQLLCSPFDLQLRLNLWAATSASRKQYIGCRLSEIEQNVTNAFTQGSFIASGGWRTFHAVSADPRNNQFGAFILASDALNTEFIRKANQSLRELSEGRGFLSYKKCVAYSPTKNASGGHDCVQYKVETPGSLINSQLNNVFSSELRKFELADEINEVFQALVNAGLRKVFAKGGGLRSVGARQEISKPRIIADNFEDVQRKAQGDAKTNNAFNQGYTSSASDPTRREVGAMAGSGGTGTAAAQMGILNLARLRPASQSANYAEKTSADRAVDGITRDDGDEYIPAAIAKKANGTLWWEVDLDGTQYVQEIKIYKRSERSYSRTLGTVILSLYDKNTVVWQRQESILNSEKIPLTFAVGVAGDRFRIERIDNLEKYLELAEVEVYGTGGETTSAGSGASAVGFSTQATVNAGNIDANNWPITINQLAALESIFTANESGSGASVRVTIQKKNYGVYVNFAPGQAFSAFTATIKNPDTGALAFPAESLITSENNPTPYTLKNGTITTAKNQHVSAGYNLTPTTAARGQYFQIITEFLDPDGRRIPGAFQTLQFFVAN